MNLSSDLEKANCNQVQPLDIEEKIIDLLDSDDEDNTHTIQHISDDDDDDDDIPAPKAPTPKNAYQITQRDLTSWYRTPLTNSFVFVFLASNNDFDFEFIQLCGRRGHFRVNQNKLLTDQEEIGSFDRWSKAISWSSSLGEWRQSEGPDLSSLPAPDPRIALGDRVYLRNGSAAEPISIQYDRGLYICRLCNHATVYLLISPRGVIYSSVYKLGRDSLNNVHEMAMLIPDGSIQWVAPDAGQEGDFWKRNV
eukprot:TRINITY_DN1455_c0_g1_i1.p1 TRINITY_DN1455_c0_g1~~TRINITY_DN1455_c0_g1_i1.p1  ORF type:complete len:251 (-),score=24.80 TRINITY_DN1455_c0_g1_i1:265-1017(-)